MKQFILNLILLIACCCSYAQHTEKTLPIAQKHAITDSTWQLNEVEVVARKQKKVISGILSGKLELQMSGLKTLPKFLGTTDPLRTMQLMPGVQTAGELNSGIYIRGGEPGHNQILLNGAPIYNAMHLLGFFSIFNSDHFSKSTLLKSYISPDYGGRLAGVLAMQAKDSLTRNFSASGSIGLIASQATLSLPLTSKTSLYLSARTTYINPIVQFIEKSEDNMKIKYDFQDYNLTYVYQPTPSDKLIINGYYGKDNLSIKENLYQAKGGINWRNIASSIQWQGTYSRNRRMEQTLFFSRYDNKIDVTQNEIQIYFPSDITDIGYKGNFQFDFLRSRWTIGADYTYHFTNPQYPIIKQMFGPDSGTEAPGLYRTQEAGAFINYHTDFSSGFSMNIGVRYSGLFHCGEYNEKKYDLLGNEISSLHYKKGELVQFYGGFEPRLSVEYSIESNKRVIFSYGLHRQYMNQVAVSGIGFPTDFWMPASKNILPQRAHALSGGYFQSLFNDTYELSAEVYYKHLNNQTEFDGELFDMINRRYLIEERILRGKGQTYGAELMIKKNAGKLTGWISYSLGWAWRKFPAINEGKAFPSKHDRRHDLSVVANYELNKKWDFSAVFVYATGNAFTMPTALYLIGENAINEYGPHNGARMPAYHRLDLSVNYWFKKSSTRESGLNVSLYNAYARENPVFLGVKIKPDKENKNIRISKTGRSLYSILPSVSYIFKF